MLVRVSPAYLEARKVGDQYGKLRIFAVEHCPIEQWCFFASVSGDVSPNRSERDEAFVLCALRW